MLNKNSAFLGSRVNTGVEPVTSCPPGRKFKVPKKNYTALYTEFRSICLMNSNRSNGRSNPKDYLEEFLKGDVPLKH